MATKPEIERLAVVETKVDAIQADVKEIKESIIGLDSKFAAKWVQNAVAFVIGIIVAAVLTALIALVVVPNINSNQSPSGTTTQTTTTTTPTGSNSTAKTSATPPSANANANARSTPDHPSSTDSQSSNGGLQVTLPKLN